MRRHLVFFLALGVLLAGCASRTGENTVSASPPASTTPATPTGNASDAAFVLAGPTLRFAANGTETTTFHEDDDARAHYELSLTPGATRDATALAALVVEGKVVDVQTVHLQPGETRKFDEPLSLGNLGTVHVQVKVGAAVGSVNATIVKWPRANEQLALGGGTATLTAWSNDSAGLHATLYVWTPADGSVGQVEVALLCPDAHGKLQALGAQPATLEPGAASASSLDFPACAAPHGLAFHETETSGIHEGRILFG
ncbi:MAG: hypothetical protein QOE90_954 [Thermoplasmata archaeon]|jgi:hypothetical protein|nr:hypothetical protein [Thermoplasmata archaeon]